MRDDKVDGMHVDVRHLASAQLSSVEEIGIIEHVLYIAGVVP